MNESCSAYISRSIMEHNAVNSIPLWEGVCIEKNKYMKKAILPENMLDLL